jgi:hypothetical protein
MRRAYVIVGELEDTDHIDVFYAICHSMDRADELCLEAESADPGRIYTWREIVEEDD